MLASYDFKCFAMAGFVIAECRCSSTVVAKWDVVISEYKTAIYKALHFKKTNPHHNKQQYTISFSFLLNVI